MRFQSPPLSLALAFLILDQAIKYIFLVFQPDWILGNRGVAFGLFQGFPIQLLALIVSTLLIAAVLLVSRTARLPLLSWGGSLLFFGSLSNLIDRLVFGYVLDYLPLGGDWRINLGDLMISAGLILLWLFLVWPKVGLWLEERAA